MAEDTDKKDVRDDGQPKEQSKSILHIEFDDIGSIQMRVFVQNIVPAQMAVAAWYLEEQSKLGLMAQMEQQMQLAQAKHIMIPTTKH